MDHAPQRGNRAHVVETTGAATREIFRLLGDAENKAGSLGASLSTSERLAELGLWAAMVAHEFNNILTPVLSYSQIALSKPDDRELATQALERAASGVERAVAVAELILDFLRASSGQEAGVRCEIETCLDGALAGMGRDLAEGNVLIHRRIQAGLSAAIREAGLGQVFHNLLTNSWQALSEAGGGEIEIEGGVCSTWNNRVEIWFRDTGPGLPRGARDRLMGSWEDATLSNGGAKGNGLGLLVCRKMLEGAGGSIEVVDEKGWGAVFRIVLPAA